jgi:hypothetical protein
MQSPSWPEQLGDLGEQDPWLCDPGFRRVCFFQTSDPTVWDGPKNVKRDRAVETYSEPGGTDSSIRGRMCSSRVRIRAHVFQRRIASSFPAGRRVSAFSYQSIACRNQ